HTGSLTGEDMVYDAAFKRAGIIRVEETADLFNCAEVLGMQPLPKGPSLAIITNAGGPGVMAADALIANGGKLAKLGQKTMKILNKILPYYWSKGNPIDILGDAKPDRYKTVVETCLKDENIDGLLLIYTPQGIANATNIARGIVKLCKHKTVPCGTILTSFMGYVDVEEANRIFTKNNIPTYSTPEQAVTAYMYMYQYKRNLELLHETPEELAVDVAPPKRPLMVIMRKAARENREMLTEFEAKQLLAYYNIPVVKTLKAKTADEAALLALQLGYPVVLKILSPQITHKTDAGGVMLNIGSKAELLEAYTKITQKAKKYNPDAEIYGVTIQPMIKKPGYEVILARARASVVNRMS
ncbi:MAG: acetate--CoA ligase family protein, partial [Candidatus Bathyarchaeota archaeon]